MMVPQGVVSGGSGESGHEDFMDREKLKLCCNFVLQENFCCHGNWLRFYFKSFTMFGMYYVYMLEIIIFAIFIATDFRTFLFVESKKKIHISRKTYAFASF